MMNTIHLTKQQLRTFLMNYQGLSDPSEFEGKDGIIKLFDRIGTIQFDPLNIIGKNADLVLQARIPNFKEKTLTEMLYEDRTLIDGWDKMMSIYLTKDFSNFHRIRDVKDREIKNMLRHRNHLEALDFKDDVLNFIKENGPTYPKDIKLGNVTKSVWGHGKISSVVSDYLWNIGLIGVYEKNNVIKKYDLIENLIDNSLINEDPLNDIEKFKEWYVLRKIGHLGIYWDKPGPIWQAHYIYKDEDRKPVIERLVKDQRLTLVKVEGLKENFYIRTKDVSLLDRPTSKEKLVKFIAPLDNLMWDRKFLQKVFDFDYTWEVYVPEDKRKYGYYVIPVLYGDKFIARFEPDGTRSKKDFSVKNWWWEEGVQPSSELIEEVIQAFNRFTDFLGHKPLNRKQLEKKLNLKS